MKWGLNKPKLKCYYAKHIQLNSSAILQKKHFLMHSTLNDFAERFSSVHLFKAYKS